MKNSVSYKDLLNQVNEIYGELVDLDEMKSYENGAFVTKGQKEVVKAFLKASPRKKKIHDALLVCFQTMNRDNGYVCFNFIQNQGLNSSQIKDIKEVFESCDFVKQLDNKRYIVTKQHLIEQKQTYVNYYKDTTESKAMEHTLNKFGITKTSLIDGLIDETKVLRFSINRDFYLETKSLLADVESIKNDIGTDVELKKEQKDSYNSYIENFQSLKDFATMKSTSARIYSAIQTMPKWFRKNYYKGYTEYDMSNAHGSIYIQAMHNIILKYNPKMYETTNWDKLYRQWQVIYPNLIQNIVEFIELNDLFTNDDKILFNKDVMVETFNKELNYIGNDEEEVELDMKSIVKDGFVRWMNSYGFESKYTKRIVEIIEMYFRSVNPHFVFVVNYCKGICRNRKESVIHLELTTLEQELIQGIQIRIAKEFGILALNQHDGLMLKDGIDNDGIALIIDEETTKFKSKWCFSQEINIIRKRIW